MNARVKGVAARFERVRREPARARARVEGGRMRALAALGLAAAASLLLPAPAAAQSGVPPPNIVFVLFDDAGFSDFGSYGSEIATPTIDALAREGVRFSNFHTASNCEASRAIVHSGVDNHRAGAGALMPVIADSQKGKPGYEGYLSDQVHSLGTLMRDGGYETYFAGKWDLGHGLQHAPGARGWDRYLVLEQTGADNYEAKVWAPFYTEAVWWQDGQRYHPGKDFYSSKTYADTLIRFIDEGRTAGKHKPFFAMLSLQAVHSPLQAPQADIDKYAKLYEAGWDAIRAERYRRQVQMGLMPPGLELPHVPAALGFPYMRSDAAWSSLGEAEQREFARKMAVYAGMLANADQQIGRLREHLKRIGELDNTVFVIMSDNGADFTDTSRINLPFRAWYRMNYPAGSDKMGGPGSYVHYGPYWAEASNTPFALIKGSPGEGGMRVPFILSLPPALAGGIKKGAIVDGFTYATDVLPTLLELGAIALPGDEYKGKPLHRPTGHSLLPYLRGETPRVHAADEPIGFESLGAQALFKGDYKVTRMGAPFDGKWRLYDLKADPTESTDLSARKPELLKAMLADVEAYDRSNGVILPEPGFDPIKQLLRNNWPVLLQQLWPVLAAALLALAAAAWGLVWIWRRWRRGGRRLQHAH
ncbi:MAG TPA: arylsulfatase [Burkholderiaceae bacterium]|nr:arylsulfatase [Burkholderiaceae bacterium]